MAKGQTKNRLKSWLLADVVLCLYLGYLIGYRWNGRLPDSLVPSLFTHTNLLFSLWFVPFLVAYGYALRQTIDELRVVERLIGED